MRKQKLLPTEMSEWEKLQDRRQFIEQFFKVNPTSGTNEKSREVLREELREIKGKLNKLAVLGITF
jgi:hypothetical protein